MDRQDLQDRLAQEVPSSVLRYFAVDMHKLKPGRPSSDAYAEVIAHHERARAESRDLLNEFQFAGRTAVNCWLPLSNIAQQWTSQKGFCAALERKYGRDILIEGIRPTLDETPKAIQAFRFQDRVVLAFGYSKGERRVWQDYRVVRIPDQRVDFVIIHFDPFMVEVRVPANQNEAFKKAVLDVMGIEEEVTWECLTRLSEAEITELKDRLGSQAAVARHKETKGGLEYREWGAAPDTEDLYDLETYQEESRGKPFRKGVFVFDHQYSIGLVEKVKYRVTSSELTPRGKVTGGGLWFLSPVGEEVITRVIDIIRDIRRDTLEMAANALAG